MKLQKQLPAVFPLPAPKFKSGFMEDATTSYINELLKNNKNSVKAVLVYSKTSDVDICVVCSDVLRLCYKAPENVRLTVIPRNNFEEDMKKYGKQFQFSEFKVVFGADYIKTIRNSKSNLAKTGL